VGAEGVWALIAQGCGRHYHLKSASTPGDLLLRKAAIYQEASIGTVHGIYNSVPFTFLAKYAIQYRNV
jgi:hypothetical protein